MSVALINSTDGHRPPLQFNLQSGETTELVYQRHGRPAISPTPHHRDEIALLSHSAPSSNLVDRKFHAPHSATPAKSGWLRYAAPRTNDRGVSQVPHLANCPLPVSKASSVRSPGSNR